MVSFVFFVLQGVFQKQRHTITAAQGENGVTAPPVMER